MERRAIKRPRLDLDDVVYGVHAVTEALAGGEALKRIHIGGDRRADPALRRLLGLALEREVPVRFEARTFFATFPYKAHQSVVAFGVPFEYVSLAEALRVARAAEQGPLLVVLDHITDPHNVGAIVRSAECAGADAVIVPERRAAGVNATVRKAAAGATAHLPIARVSNVAQALRELKRARIWVAGADSGPPAQPYTEVDFRRETALVIGAEGGGLSPLVRRECDYLVAIPMAGRVASLNASVAAGVLLYEARRQRGPLSGKSP